MQALVGRGEYFMGILSDGSALVHPLGKGERMPMQLGREILAELAGKEDKADWRKCAAGDQEAEAARAEAFKAWFKAFDIMQG